MADSIVEAIKSLSHNSLPHSQFLRGILRGVDEDDEEDEDEGDDELEADEDIEFSNLAAFGSFPPGGTSDAGRRVGMTVLKGFGAGPLSPV